MATVTNPVMWTVKSIAEEAKDHALAQAKSAGVPVGLWLEKLLLAHRDGQAPPPLPGSGPRIDLRQLAEIMRATADIMAASGKPIPKRAVSAAYSLVSHELRHSRQALADRPKQAQVEADHTTSISTDAGRLNGSTGMTPAIASSDV